MSKLEIETRDSINQYYNTKIEKLQEKLNVVKEKHKEQCYKNFDNDSDVIKVNELFKKIKERYYNLSLSLNCYINTGCYNHNDYKYELNKDYLEIENEITMLSNEKRILLLKLESYTKTSNEYKKEIENFINKIRKENKK